MDAMHANDDAQAAEKEVLLIQWLRGAARVAIGYSGGVDSAYLAVVARNTLGMHHVLAVIGRSASYPAEQWAAARQVAESFGILVAEVDTDELNDPKYAANPSNRCYFCKSELWSRLVPFASRFGFQTVVDGTNADDLGDYRPGAQAAREQGIRSPLADCGFTKSQIRHRSRLLGIPTWSQPSSPCLSSRLPYGTRVTTERLALIEETERAIRRLGIVDDLRVRYHDDLARVELSCDELAHWLVPERFARLRDVVIAAGFPRMALDLRGFRSGSLNVLHGVGAA